MKGMIGFKNHRISCIIGVYPHEQVKEQELFVDLRVEILFGNDHLAETVDYVKLAELCTSIAHKNTHRLIETYGAEVLKALAAQFPILSAEIKIKKPAALATAEYTFVELKWAGR